jgi:hypothetical protein
VSCLSASPYRVPEPEEAGGGPDGNGRAPEQPRPSREVVSAAAPGAGHDVQTRDNGASTSAPPTDGAAKGGERSLTLRIRETDQPQQDRRLLDDIRRLLLEYRGEDPVSLEIAVEGRVVTLEWPLVSVNICGPLENGLRELLGQDGHMIVKERPR